MSVTESSPTINAQNRSQSEHSSPMSLPRDTARLRLTYSLQRLSLSPAMPPRAARRPRPPHSLQFRAFDDQVCGGGLAELSKYYMFQCM